MAIQTLTGIPREIQSGDTVLFTETFADFPPASWTLTLWLSLAGGTPVSVIAITSGANYLITISQAVSAALVAGTYQFTEIVTNGTQTATAKEGTVAVLPNLTKAQTPSFAQAQIGRWQTTIAELSQRRAKERNFSGQQSLDQDIAEATRQLAYWQAQYVAEQAKLNAQRGSGDTMRIATQFAPNFNDGPFACRLP